MGSNQKEGGREERRREVKRSIGVFVGERGEVWVAFNSRNKKTGFRFLAGCLCLLLIVFLFVYLSDLIH